MLVTAQWETCPQRNGSVGNRATTSGLSRGLAILVCFISKPLQSYIYMLVQSSVGLDTIHREERLLSHFLYLNVSAFRIVIASEDHPFASEIV